VPGRKEANTLKIPLSGASVPEGLKSIILEVFVAGQSFSYSFSQRQIRLKPSHGTGRIPTAERCKVHSPFTVNIGYVYGGVYLQASERPGNGYEALFGHFHTMEYLLLAIVSDWRSLSGRGGRM